MNKKILFTLLVLVLLSAGAYYFVSRQSAPYVPAPVVQEMPAVNVENEIPPAVVTENASVPAPVAVEISGFAFNPKEIRIPAGTKVIWTNQDSARHTVTANNGEFGSQLFGKGETFEFTFSQKGTFAYYCMPHPNMKATVIVE